jgi:hypothetical protein
LLGGGLSLECGDRLTESSPKPAGAARDVSPSPSGKAPAAAIRLWARENGIPVADRGRIKPEVKDAYDAAHAGDGEPSTASARQYDEPGIDSHEPLPAFVPIPSAEDVDHAWNSGRSYQLDRDGFVMRRGGGTDLATVIGRATARPVVQAMLRMRPYGGVFKVDRSGAVVTYTDGSPTFVMWVTPENWFPEHWT